MTSQGLTQTQITTANFISADYIGIKLYITIHAQITEKIKVAIVANFRLRKSRPCGNCHVLTGILGIFEPITALKSPCKNSTLHCIKLDYYIPR
jgi:hypothetical protein